MNDQPGRRMLLVHAHPDDETLGNGATMAKYAAEGTQVTLLTCTRGEEGLVLVPELEHLAAHRDDRLGAHRETELAAAMAALGVRDHRFLDTVALPEGPGLRALPGLGHGLGRPTTARSPPPTPDRTRSPASRSTRRRRESLPSCARLRPHVVVTYEPGGGYGHPDHVQAHRVAMRGGRARGGPTARAGPAWTVPKVYWNVLPEGLVRAALRELAASEARPAGLVAGRSAAADGGPGRGRDDGDRRRGLRRPQAGSARGARDAGRTRGRHRAGRRRSPAADRRRRVLPARHGEPVGSPRRATGGRRTSSPASTETSRAGHAIGNRRPCARRRVCARRRLTSPARRSPLGRRARSLRRAGRRAGGGPQVRARDTQDRRTDRPRTGPQAGRGGDVARARERRRQRRLLRLALVLGAVLVWLAQRDLSGAGLPAPSLAGHRPALPDLRRVLRRRSPSCCSGRRSPPAAPRTWCTARSRSTSG